MALIGYAHVSSIGQSLQVQQDKLSHCEKVFEEKKSAASGKSPRCGLSEIYAVVDLGEKYTQRVAFFAISLLTCFSVTRTTLATILTLHPLI